MDEGRNAPRGGLCREERQRLVAEGLSVRGIAERTGFSATAVRHWLKRHGLATEKAATRGPGPKPREILRTCARHGRTRFMRGASSGHYRCARCRSEAVAERRRRVKEILVAESGGCCSICGYDRSPAALQFHHLDPAAKAFALARGGVTRSLDAARAEAAKCALLCANCHAEVEAGFVDYPPSGAGSSGVAQTA